MTKFIKQGLLVLALVVLGQVILSKTALAYSPVPGDLVKTAHNPTVYLVDDNGQRIPMEAKAFAIRYNNNFSLVKIVTAFELGSFATYLRIDGADSHPDGSLVVYSLDNGTVYMLDHGYKHPVGSWDTLQSQGYDLSHIQWIGELETYPTK